MPRLFVALRPPAAIRDQLSDLMEGVEDARWQDDEQLHLTIRYIGEVDGRTADAVVDTLARLGVGDFDLSCQAVGYFDRRGRAEALWAGIKDDGGARRLHKKVDHALVGIGLPAEGRAYLPHVTVARLGRTVGPIEAWLAAKAGFATDAFAARHLCLFESVLGREGACYSLVERWPLR